MHRAWKSDGPLVWSWKHSIMAAQQHESDLMRATRMRDEHRAAIDQLFRTFAKTVETELDRCSNDGTQGFVLNIENHTIKNAVQHVQHVNWWSITYGTTYVYDNYINISTLFNELKHPTAINNIVPYVALKIAQNLGTAYQSEENLRTAFNMLTIPHGIKRIKIAKYMGERDYYIVVFYDADTNVFKNYDVVTINTPHLIQKSVTFPQFQSQKPQQRQMLNTQLTDAIRECVTETLKTTNSAAEITLNIDMVLRDFKESSNTNDETILLKLEQVERNIKKSTANIEGLVCCVVS